MDRTLFAQIFEILPTGQHADKSGLQERRKLWSQRRVPLSELSWSGIADDMGRIRQSLGMEGAWSKAWLTELKRELASHGALWLTFFVLFGVTQYLMNKGRLYVKGLLGKTDKDRFPFRHLSLYLIHRSLLLAGATLLVYLYIFLASPATAVPGVLRFFASVLMIVLFTRWARCFVKYLSLSYGAACFLCSWAKKRPLNGHTIGFHKDSMP
jgi:hypothetical protein